MSPGSAVFVDRDGVLNQLCPDPVTGRPESPLRVPDVVLLPGVASALRALTDQGWRLVGASNQPAAAKGSVSVEQLQSVHARVLELLEHEGVRFDDFRICWHHPEGVVAELTRECACRKPRPGMLLEAARALDIDLGSSWMVGDTDSDVRAGILAGCRTALIEHEPSSHKRGAEGKPEVRVADLRGAADVILRGEPVH